MNIHTLLRNPNFPSCLRCGKHLTRLPVRNRPLHRLATIFRLFPFSCEGCRHRFLAFAWPGRYLEWDGHILVMPSGDNLLQTLKDGALEFFILTVILVLVCVAGVWLLIHGTTVTSGPHAITGKP